MNNTLLNGTKLEWADVLNKPTINNDNTSWNQTYANTLYYPLSANPAGYLTGYTESDPFYNRSWNETRADSKYLQSVPYQSSAAGWTNDSTSTTTNLNINASNITGNYIRSYRLASTTQYTEIDGGDIVGGYIRQSTAGKALTLYNNGPVQISNTTSYNFVVLANGNVGIGTTNPTSKLHVNGTVKFANILAADTRVEIAMDSGNGGLYVHNGPTYATGGSQVKLELQNPTDTATALNISNAGKGYAVTIGGNNFSVGIGTYTPTASLDVRAHNTGTPNIVAQATAGQTAPILQWKESGAQERGGIEAEGSIYVKRGDVADINGPIFKFLKAGNTSGSYNPVMTGTTLGQIQYRGYNGSSYNTGAYIAAVTTQAFNSTGAGTQLDFYTTPTNSLTNNKAVTISNQGSLSVYGISGTADAVIYLAAAGGKASFMYLNTNHVSYGGITITNSTFSSAWTLGSRGQLTLNNSIGLLHEQSSNMIQTWSRTGTGINKRFNTQALDVNGSINISGDNGKLYLPNIPGTGRQICINETDMSLFRNTTCP